MRIVAVIFGIVLIVLVAQDGFESVILPRQVSRRIRLARLFIRATRFGWDAIGDRIRSSSRRESFRAYVGPLSLLALLGCWAVLFVLGFGLLMWGLALPLNISAINGSDTGSSFLIYLYLSGTTFFTIGLGDVIQVSGVGRLLVVSEVALGFTFLALMISYVPVFYQAFSRRELRISLLDARAGSPPTAVELLRRNDEGSNFEELRLLLHEWEGWCADLLESHLSYPILVYYRSQHEQQSWVEALTVILDTCADPDVPGRCTPGSRPLYLCSGPTCRRRPGPDPPYPTHARREPVVNSGMDAGAREAGGSGLLFEGRNGKRAEVGRAASDV